MEKENKFMFFEKLFFRINMSLVGLSIVLVLVMFAFLDRVDYISDIIFNFITIFLLGSLANFFISVGRIIKYLIKYREYEDISIKRSVINLVTSPIAVALYWFILIIMALSMASCS